MQRNPRNDLVSPPNNRTTIETFPTSGSGLRGPVGWDLEFGLGATVSQVSEVAPGHTPLVSLAPAVQ